MHTTQLDFILLTLIQVPVVIFPQTDPNTTRHIYEAHRRAYAPLAPSPPLSHTVTAADVTGLARSPRRAKVRKLPQREGPTRASSGRASEVRKRCVGVGQGGTHGLWGGEGEGERAWERATSMNGGETDGGQGEGGYVGTVVGAARWR